MYTAFDAKLRPLQLHYSFYNYQTIGIVIMLYIKPLPQIILIVRVNYCAWIRVKCYK